MPEVIGIDHIYITVSDMERSERFYDAVMQVLGFRKNQFLINSEKHVQYYNRDFGYVLRSARVSVPHDPYAPGLHHICLRVESNADVKDASDQLGRQDIFVSEPRLYPEYAPDYFAVFFSDPDGMRLEIANYRKERRQRRDNWQNVR